MGVFTIRVYGIVQEYDRVLLSREEIRGRYYVKFPGGGLEYGEGTIDCLLREIKEETGMEATVQNHFYTTDFFQPSAFHQRATQVISIYYTAQLMNSGRLRTVEALGNTPGFFWQPMAELDENVLDLPIDKLVARKLMKQH